MDDSIINSSDSDSNSDLILGSDIVSDFDIESDFDFEFELESDFNCTSNEDNSLSDVENICQNLDETPKMSKKRPVVLRSPNPNNDYDEDVTCLGGYYETDFSPEEVIRIRKGLELTDVQFSDPRVFGKIEKYVSGTTE